MACASTPLTLRLFLVPTPCPPLQFSFRLKATGLDRFYLQLIADFWGRILVRSMRAALMLFCCVLIQSADALASGVHIHALWSWKPAGQSWHYTLTPDDPDHFDYAAILHSRNVCVGEAALEARFASLPPNHHAVWREGPPKSPLRFPPEAFRNRVIALARKHGVHLEPIPMIVD